MMQHSTVCSFPFNYSISGGDQFLDYPGKDFVPEIQEDKYCIAPVLLFIYSASAADTKYFCFWPNM